MKERQYASALACLTAALLGSCSSEMPEQKAPEEQAGGITFRITLPSAGKVQYGGSRAAIHEEEEYTVKDLKVFQYKSDSSPDLVRDELVATYDFSEAAGTLHPAGEGTVNPGVYTVTLPKDASLNYSEPYRFYFVANVATLTKQGISFDSYTAGTGADTDRYGHNLCNQGMVLKNDVTQSGSVPAEKLHEDWFVMSGMARVNGATGDGSDVIMIKPASVNDMNVQLNRIEARIDLYSNAPNLMITDAWIEDAYFGGFVMDTHTDAISAATFGKGTVTVNNKNRGGALGKAVKNLPMNAAGTELDPYAEYDDALRLNQTYSPNADADVTIGVRKALYMFERNNSDADHAEIKVRYRLKDGSMGIATVPFRERLADGTAGDYVNVERNHLYKVVLGNGDEIKSGARVEGLIIDEPWNVVDLPAVVDGPDNPVNTMQLVEYYPNGNSAFMLKNLSTAADKDTNPVWGLGATMGGSNPQFLLTACHASSVDDIQKECSQIGFSGTLQMDICELTVYPKNELITFGNAGRTGDATLVLKKDETTRASVDALKMIYISSLFTTLRSDVFCNLGDNGIINIPECLKHFKSESGAEELDLNFVKSGQDIKIDLSKTALTTFPKIINHNRGHIYFYLSNNSSGSVVKNQHLIDYLKANSAQSLGLTGDIYIILHDDSDKQDLKNNVEEILKPFIGLESDLSTTSFDREFKFISHTDAETMFKNTLGGSSDIWDFGK